MEEQIKIIKHWLGSGSINLFGAPFAGKDTQGVILAELLGGEVISSGQLLRQSNNNPKLQEYLAAGHIVPSELFFEIVLPHLKSEHLKNKPLILSEMGRKNMAEANGTIKVAEESGHPLEVVVLLTLSDDEAWKRFNQSKLDGDRGQRADDNANVLQLRLDKFKNEVMPVIDFYRSRNQLIEVDGTPSKDKVTNLIIEALFARASQV